MAEQKTPVAAPKVTTPADRPRVMHLLILPSGTTGAFLDFEPFTGEIAARRELDNRPDWKYVAITPGATYKARIEQAAKS